MDLHKRILYALALVALLVTLYEGLPNTNDASSIRYHLEIDHARLWHMYLARAIRERLQFGTGVLRQYNK